MSSVRMCDEPTCGLIFSELEEDWATAEVSRRVFNQRTGHMDTITVQEDRCPKHASSGRHRPIPQVSLPGMDDVVQ